MVFVAASVTHAGRLGSRDLVRMEGGTRGGSELYEAGVAGCWVLGAGCGRRGWAGGRGQWCVGVGQAVSARWSMAKAMCGLIIVCACAWVRANRHVICVRPAQE
jgi:hypothetical protein